jgi:capsid protein
MGFLAKVSTLARGMFGYDAVLSTGRRKSPALTTRHEDDELTGVERAGLVNASRDITRNFSLAAWAVRRHLDYVSTFTFQAKTLDAAGKADRRLNKYLEGWMYRVSQPREYDAAGRHSLASATRLAEARRTLDGDILEVRLGNGRVQWVEGDRIRDPIGGDTTRPGDAARLFHGVQVDEAGAALAYAVHKRQRRVGMQFERWLDARNCYLHGYFDRFDQVRGISPLAPALNTLRDTYKGIDYALGKLLVSQLFALAIYREKSEDLGSAAEDDDTGYKIDFGRGPTLLDLEPGDKADFLESKSPSTELQSYLQSTIGMSIKALDIPYSFYAENFTNYSGARQALLQYQMSATTKQGHNRARLDDWTLWRMRLAAIDGELQLDRDPAELNWDWVPAGMPWIDPLKEIQAQKEAIAAGLGSRTEFAKARGRSLDEVLDELAAEEEAARERGITFDKTLTQSQQLEVVTNG